MPRRAGTDVASDALFALRREGDLHRVLPTAIGAPARSVAVSIGINAHWRSYRGQGGDHEQLRLLGCHGQRACIVVDGDRTTAASVATSTGTTTSGAFLSTGGL
jgi:hypothetical protein